MRLQWPHLTPLEVSAEDGSRSRLPHLPPHSKIYCRPRARLENMFGQATEAAGRRPPARRPAGPPAPSPKSVAMCACVCERERERERECVCVQERARVRQGEGVFLRACVRACACAVRVLRACTRRIHRVGHHRAAMLGAMLAVGQTCPRLAPIQYAHGSSCYTFR